MVLRCAAIAILLLTYCTNRSTAQTTTVDLTFDAKVPFQFVVYGDTRFHDPKDTEAANPTVRRALVEAIAEANPTFVCMTGDIVYNGFDADDWTVWDSGHVHNYERHEHGGVTYFVSGGGAAHAYPITRAANDPFQSNEINYHYLLIRVAEHELAVTMNRIDLTSGKPIWTQPDSVKIAIPSHASAQTAAH